MTRVTLLVQREASPLTLFKDLALNRTYTSRSCLKPTLRPLREQGVRRRIECAWVHVVCGSVGGRKVVRR